MGIKETQEALIFLSRLGNAAGIYAETKDASSTIPAVISALTAALPAFENASLIPTELKDLDQAEADALVEVLKTELDLPQDETESAIEDGLPIVLMINNWVNKYAIKN